MTDDTLSAREERWATLLSGYSLVTEVDIEPTEAIAGLAEVAHLYRRRSSAKDWRLRELHRYPATIVVGLTAIGSLDYDDGKYWPQFRERTGLPHTQYVALEFSDAFRQGLKRFRLSRFDLPQRNVGEILMHAGIPLTSMEGLLNLLVERSQLRPDLTGPDFCAWISRLTDSHANQKGLDVPTRRFLREGREIAFDLIDRYLAVIDAMSSGTSDQLEVAVAELPSYMAGEARHLIKAGRVRKLTHAKRRISRQSPEIVYIDQLVQVQLPSSILEQSRDWTFTAGDRSWIDETHPPLFHDPNHLSYIEIPTPADSITCKTNDGELSWALDMVDPSTQILAFSKANHILISSRAELPSEEVWLALPPIDSGSDSIEDALEVEGEYHLLEVADTPFGWDGWTFALLDLEHTKRLRLRETKVWRWISKIATPRLFGEATVRHLIALDGNPVLDRAPRILIPGTSPERQMRHVIVISHPDGELLHQVEIEPNAEEQFVDPWQTFPKPMLGTWNVRVRGALGRGRAFTVHVAERCSVSAEPTYRYFSDQGILEPCSALISIDGAATSIELPAGIPEAHHLLQGAHGALNVKVAPACMWVRVEHNDASAHRSYNSVPLESEVLADTTLHFYIPRAMKPEILLTCEQEAIQESRPTSLRSNASRVRLGQFADTARGLGKLELWCDWEQDRNLLATIAPRKLLYTTTVEDDWLTVTKAHESLDLDISISLDYAPWLPPEKIRMPSGTTRLPLPASCVGRGPLQLTARIYDPWGEAGTYPISPADNPNIFSVNSSVSEDLETIDDQLIHWIIGNASLPKFSEVLERGLQSYGSFPNVRGGPHLSVLYQEFADFTRNFSRQFIKTAIRASWTRETHTRLLAEGWPATAETQAHPMNYSTWTTSPYLGLLESGARTDDPLWWEQIDVTLGADALSILNTGLDRNTKSGSFHADAVLIANLPKDRQDQMWRDVAVTVRGAFLSASKRQVHSRPLFDARADPRLQELVDRGSEVIRFATSELTSHTAGIGIPAIQARITDLGWQALPALSLSIAFIGRLAARGLGRAALGFELYRAFFADLATLAPEFVEQDLILAELWLIHWETHEDH